MPTRSAAQITDIIARAHGVLSIRAHGREPICARSGVSRAALSAEPARAFGRYEASRRNEIWIGDVLIGPFVPHPRQAGSTRAKLFVLVDDYSRLLVQGRWMEEENTRAGQDVLRAAVCRRGVPENLLPRQRRPISLVPAGPDLCRARGAPRALQALLASWEGKAGKAQPLYP